MEVIIYGAALLLLFLMAIEDARTKMIHNIFLYGLILDGVLAIIILGDPDPLSGVAGAVCVSLPMALMNLIAKGSFGTADILICIGAGLLLGPWGILTALGIAGGLSGLLGGFLLISGRAGRRDTIPFAPFLAIGIGFVIVIY